MAGGGAKKVAAVLGAVCLAAVAGLLLLCVPAKDLREAAAFKVSRGGATAAPSTPQPERQSRRAGGAAEGLVRSSPGGLLRPPVGARPIASAGT